MEKKFRKALFLFRRDLRLEDNTGLIFALKSSEVVIPAFIFTPEQIERNQDMHFPDSDGGKMYRTEKGAMWKGKKGNFDISVSIDDKDPYTEFKTEWSKKTKDEPKRLLLN